MLREQARQERLDVEGIDVTIAVRVAGAGGAWLAGSEQQVEEGEFREDLFYRINTFPIHLPPLRERRDDIALLANHYLVVFAERNKRELLSISPEAMELMMSHEWRGNVRELQNVIERAVIISRGPQLELGEWPPAPVLVQQESQTLTLEELERKHILDVLEKARWQVSGAQGAATILGIKPTTLESRMKKLGIRRES